MSKGSKGYHWRCPPALEQAMLKQIEMSFVTRRETPWKISDFIRIAVREKLAKMKRCREYRKNNKLKKGKKHEQAVEAPQIEAPQDARQEEEDNLFDIGFILPDLEPGLSENEQFNLYKLQERGFNHPSVTHFSFKDID